jgi:hypothetical protein
VGASMWRMHSLPFNLNLPVVTWSRTCHCLRPASGRRLLSDALCLPLAPPCGRFTAPYVMCFTVSLLKCTYLFKVLPSLCS